MLTDLKVLDRIQKVLKRRSIMQKLNELNDERKHEITEHLEAASSALGFDSWEGSNGDFKLLEDQIGMCHNCKNLSYCKTEFGSVLARCDAFEIRLSGQNRMTECNLHAPRGILSLNEMYAMAVLIDADEPEVKGFISTDPRLKRKKKSSV